MTTNYEELVTAVKIKWKLHAGALAFLSQVKETS